MSNELFLLLVLAALQVVRVAALHVAISPEHVREGSEPHNVTFTCAADSALVGCEFRWWNYQTEATGPLLDLSRGPQSRADPDHLNDKLRGYSYTGRGLGEGDCGVTLQLDRWQEWIVACRVKAERSGWKYAWASLYADAWGPIPHTNLTSPREVVALPGGETRMSVKSPERLNDCSFRFLGMSNYLYFTQGAASPRSTGRHCYLGDGLGGGQCGLALSGITEADNGPVRIYVQAPGYKNEVRFMVLIVAGPPSAPTISLVYSGINLTATCRVGNSRPVANITWILSDKVIRQGENLDDTWRWPWMKGSIQQTLTLQLKPEDQGQVLKCAASHVALVQPLEAWAEIVIPDATSGTTS